MYKRRGLIRASGVFCILHYTQILDPSVNLGGGGGGGANTIARAPISADLRAGNRLLADGAPAGRGFDCL